MHNRSQNENSCYFIHTNSSCRLQPDSDDDTDKNNSSNINNTTSDIIVTETSTSANTNNNDWTHLTHNTTSPILFPSFRPERCESPLSLSPSLHYSAISLPFINTQSPTNSPNIIKYIESLPSSLHSSLPSNSLICPSPPLLSTTFLPSSPTVPDSLSPHSYTSSWYESVQVMTLQHEAEIESIRKEAELLCLHQLRKLNEQKQGQIKLEEKEEKGSIGFNRRINQYKSPLHHHEEVETDSMSSGQNDRLIIEGSGRSAISYSTPSLPTNSNSITIPEGESKQSSKKKNESKKKKKRGKSQNIGKRKKKINAKAKDEIYHDKDIETPDNNQTCEKLNPKINQTGDSSDRTEDDLFDENNFLITSPSLRPTLTSIIAEDLNEKERRSKLPLRAVYHLRAFFTAHVAHPYPCDEEKEKLAVETNLSVKQITNWFTNTRRRFWQPFLKKVARAAGMNEEEAANVASKQAVVAASRERERGNQTTMIDGEGKGKTIRRKRRKKQENQYLISKSGEEKGELNEQQSEEQKQEDKAKEEVELDNDTLNIDCKINISSNQITLKADTTTVAFSSTLSAIPILSVISAAAATSVSLSAFPCVSSYSSTLSLVSSNLPNNLDLLPVLGNTTISQTNSSIPSPIYSHAQALAHELITSEERPIDRLRANLQHSQTKSEEEKDEFDERYKRKKKKQKN